MQLDLVRRHRFTVKDYYRMGEVGLLAAEVRDELIDGEIFDVPPPQHRASSVMAQLYRAFFRDLGDDAFGWSQSTFILSTFSAPRPDLVLLEPRKDSYRRVAPSPLDAMLIVEVSENTLRHDWKVKVPLYARYNIPEVWILDIERLRIHFFHTPEAARYKHASSTSAPGRTSIQAFPGRTVDLTGLFEYLAPPATRRRNSDPPIRSSPPRKERHGRQ